MVLKLSSRFKNYIQSTTAHGVVHIFIGKSHIRRAFWLLVVLASASACLANCIDRILFLASGPTTTTITLKRRQEIDFPAVTICNLNMLRRDYVQSLGLGEVVVDLLLADPDEPDPIPNCMNQLRNLSDLPDITYEEMFKQGGQDIQKFIIGCEYFGERCNVSLTNFVPTLTRQGYCYTFNGGSQDQPIRTTMGTGSTLGLRLVFDIDHDQYLTSPNLDVGVKIAVHQQTVPPEPDDQGIAVPTSTNAFISLRQLNVIDKTGENCVAEEEVSSLNFLRNETPIYSFAACNIDCFYTQVADNCNCLISDQFSPDVDNYTSLRLCTIRDTCCVLLQQTTAIACPCTPSCNSTFYQVTNSYSFFPAAFASRVINLTALNEEDILMTNIFYESLIITEEVTTYAYNVVSLLSDIGGQLGLFLGVSVISVVELLMWVLDEVKDRCGLNESKIIDSMRGHCCVCMRGERDHEPDDKKKNGHGGGDYDSATMTTTSWTK